MYLNSVFTFSIFIIKSLANENFYYVNQQLDYWEAQAYCTSTYGTYLAEIYNEYQQEQVRTILSAQMVPNDGKVWIGLDDIKKKYKIFQNLKKYSKSTQFFFFDIFCKKIHFLNFI